MPSPVDLGLGHIRIAPEACLPAPPVSGGQYGPAGGLLPLRLALAERHGVDEAMITLTTGASLALVATLATLERPGTVLCPRPYYPAYPAVAALLGFDVEYYDLEARSGWLPDLDRMGRLLGASTRAILWNYPHNPTGGVASGSGLLERARELVAGRGVVILRDEVYADLDYGAPPVPGPGPVDGEVCLHSFSKSFGLPGERLGYVIAAAERTANIRRAHWALAMSPPATAQARALALLRSDPDERLRRLRSTLARHRLVAAEILASCAGTRFSVPTGGIFFWIEVPGCPVSSEVLASLCHRHGVTVVPGAAFGIRSPTFVRASFAVPESELRSGFSRLTDVVSAVLAVEDSVA